MSNEQESAAREGPSTGARSVIGQPITRIDGRRKVTGTAPYGTDYYFEGLVYGVGVASTVGSGRIRRISTADAERMPGVLKVLHHGNFDHLYRPANQFEDQSRPGESRPPFEDEYIYYYGQYVALVVA